MQNKYIFRKIKKEEVIVMFDLIIERMKWMDEKGIQQWNVTAYEEVYPLSYYEEKRNQEEVYVLEEVEDHQIVCGAVLLEEDERWQDNTPSIYLHNFVSKIGTKGVGTIFIKEAEKYAKQKGKQYFRLDSAVNNTKLTNYYESLGYEAVGTCQDGVYEGILRQKQMN